VQHKECFKNLPMKYYGKLISAHSALCVMPQRKISFEGRGLKSAAPPPGFGYEGKIGFLGSQYETKNGTCPKETSVNEDDAKIQTIEAKRLFEAKQNVVIHSTDSSGTACGSDNPPHKRSAAVPIPPARPRRFVSMLRPSTPLPTFSESSDDDDSDDIDSPLLSGQS
jgi:hypothetical protein